MVNLFPDFVQHDTPPGRKASYLYMFLLSAGLLAAVLYYSLATAPLIKTATTNDDYFGLEMYQGTTDCGNWYSCLYQKSQGANPSVSGLSCECSSQAGKLSAMTQYPLAPNVIGPSDWCANTDLLEKFVQTLPPIQSVKGSTQEDSRAFNFFSSQSACNTAHSAASTNERVEFSGTTQATVLQHIISWQAAAAVVSSSIRFSPTSVPTASTAAQWLLRDAYLEVGVSANQAAKDKANAESGLSKAAASGSLISLGTSAGDVCDDRMFWPLVVQVNSRCRDKRSEADKFYRAMDSTYIISSTLLNQDSYTKYHAAQRVLHASSSFTSAALPPNTPPSKGDVFEQYATLGNYDYLEHLDYLQILSMYYPLFTAGYALAYAEYTQKFVLQYYGLFHNGSGTSGASATTCDVVVGSVNDVEKPACQLTFEETLKSVFPFAEESRTSKVIDQGVATAARSFMFHPTRTAGTRTVAQNTAQTLTFKHIFGRGSLLTLPGDTSESATDFHDLTPLSRVSGVSPTNSSVLANSAYTNGNNYTITDSNNLKQKVKKCKKVTTPCGGGGPQPACNECEAAYTGWSVKIVSMEAKITSLKVVWKHSAFTESDNKLKSEQMLRHLLASLNATSSSKPQFDVGVSSLSLNSGTIDLNFTKKKELKERQAVVTQENGNSVGYSLPYLFQSIDTSPTISGRNNPNKLSICTAELVDALKYTDVGGSLGTHPNYPPFPLCRSKTTAAAPGPTSPAAKVAPNPAYATEGYLVDESFTRANWLTTDWTPTITVPSTLVKTTSSATMYGTRSSAMLKALELLPKVYPLWDRTQVARENATTGYPYISPNASILASPDFSLYWSICNPHLCQWIATDKRGPAEVITSIIAIMGGIAMACKTLAELWKKVLKKKPNVVPIAHNLKVVVAGAQMTSDSVAKEE